MSLGGPVQLVVPLQMAPQVRGGGGRRVAVVLQTEVAAHRLRVQACELVPREAGGRASALCNQKQTPVSFQASRRRAGPGETGRAGRDGHSSWLYTSSGERIGPSLTTLGVQISQNIAGRRRFVWESLMSASTIIIGQPLWPGTTRKW